LQEEEGEEIRESEKDTERMKWNEQEGKRQVTCVAGMCAKGGRWQRW